MLVCFRVRVGPSDLSTLVVSSITSGANPTLISACARVMGLDVSDIKIPKGAEFTRKFLYRFRHMTLAQTDSFRDLRYVRCCCFADSVHMHLRSAMEVL